MKDRIIVALDTDSTGSALSIARTLSAEVGMFVITSYSIHYTKLYDDAGHDRGVHLLSRFDPSVQGAEQDRADRA